MSLQVKYARLEQERLQREQDEAFKERLHGMFRRQETISQEELRRYCETILGIDISSGDDQMIPQGIVVTELAEVTEEDVAWAREVLSSPSHA